MIVTLHGSPASPNLRTAYDAGAAPDDYLDVKMAACLGFHDARMLTGCSAVEYASTRPPAPTEHIVRFRLARTDPGGHRHYVFTGEIDP